MESYDYKGWKIPEKLHIFAKKHPYRKYDIPQAMIASSDKESALETAQKWASGKYSGWTKDDYIQYDIDNENIEFELLDSAGCSSQGGKLSFWNCIISKEDMRVIVGISSDILIELLKNTDFEKGKCKDKIILARYKNQWGTITKDMKEYKEAIKDMKIDNNLNTAKKTSKWKPGYEYYSKTQKSVYLYDLYQWYDIKKVYEGWHFYSDKYCIMEYDKLKTKKVVLDKWMYKDYSTLLEYINITKNMENKWKFHYLFSYLDYKDKLPSRIKGDKVFDIDVDIDTINKYLIEYRKEITDEFLKQDENHITCDISTIIGAYAYSIDKNDKPIIPQEVLYKIKTLYNVNIS